MDQRRIEHLDKAQHKKETLVVSEFDLISHFLGSTYFLDTRLSSSNSKVSMW
jgi:hypothetical protein